jgi:twinkle protein
VFIIESKLKNKEPKVYERPKWKNKTDLTDKAVKWFESRRITQTTLKKMKIYSDVEYVPQREKKEEVICYPYFRNGELVNVKYRAGLKAFFLVKNAELILYNLDVVTQNESLIIVEGEMDALTFIECGYDNVVSVPNGASSLDLSFLDSCMDDLDKIKTFYIAVDFDEQGLKLKNELVRRLGQERCKVVTFDGCKDANELFCKAGRFAIKEIIDKAVEIPIAGMIDLDYLWNDFYAMYRNGLPEGLRIGLGPIDEHIRWEVGRLAIWTGYPGCGKSEMLDFVIVKLNLLHGWKTAYFSPENYPTCIHIAKLTEKLTGRKCDKWYIAADDLEKAYDYITENFFFLEPYENATLESIIERAKLNVRRKGRKQLVIDPFNTLEHKAMSGENQTEYISRFLDEISRFAKQYDVLVHLVAHPSKPSSMRRSDGKLDIPDMYDIAGSAHFNNKADYGISVVRDFENQTTTFYPLKVRFKNLGGPYKSGIMLKYNYVNGRYSLMSELWDNNNWLNNPVQVDVVKDSEPSKVTTQIPDEDLPY